MEQTGIIILAAGNASRMGKPKQLLTYKGKSFIERIVQQATTADTSVVVVVLGAYYEEIQQVITQEEAVIVKNTSWEMGMGSSIKVGVEKMRELAPDITNIILTVADQPYVSNSLFSEMIHERKNTKKHIVACMYDTAIGTPVLFNLKYFPLLTALSGKEGAKEIVLENREDVATINFSFGRIDIDTLEDYEHLTSYKE